MSDGAEPREMRLLVLELADLLIGHSTIEERHFYPAVRDAGTAALINESLHDHQEVGRLLLHVLECDVQDEDFTEKLEELQAQVESHVREEEDELLPKVRQTMSDEELVALAHAMMATFAEEQDGGEPRERLSEQLQAAGIDLTL
jgi:DUF438 domain-containing protein